jgi:hypothetical protein
MTEHEEDLKKWRELIDLQALHSERLVRAIADGDAEMIERYEKIATNLSAAVRELQMRIAADSGPLSRTNAMKNKGLLKFEEITKRYEERTKLHIERMGDLGDKLQRLVEGAEGAKPGESKPPLSDVMDNPDLWDDFDIC